MSIVLENLVVPTLILGIIYFLLVLYGFYCYLKLHYLTPGLNTKKLFVMNCLLASILRFLSFSSMSAFNYLEIDITFDASGLVDDSPVSKLEEFFAKASLVQFDLPDFCFVSAYVLLLVVWAEAIFQSRKHWLSSYEFRRWWIMGYVVFNIFLYTLQVSLYSLLFIPTVDQRILGNLIYLTLSAFSFGIPFLWMCCYVYLSLTISGFPFMSYDAKIRLMHLGTIGTIWTIMRMLWGVIALTSVVKGWFVSISKVAEFYTIALVAVFLICEVIPIVCGYSDTILHNLVVGKSSDPSASLSLYESSYHNSVDYIDSNTSIGPFSPYDDYPYTMPTRQGIWSTPKPSQTMEDHYQALLSAPHGAIITPHYYRHTQHNQQQNNRNQPPPPSHITYNAPLNPNNSNSNSNVNGNTNIIGSNLNIHPNTTANIATYQSVQPLPSSSSSSSTKSRPITHMTPSSSSSSSAAVGVGVGVGTVGIGETSILRRSRKSSKHHIVTTTAPLSIDIDQNTIPTRITRGQSYSSHINNTNSWRHSSSTTTNTNTNSIIESDFDFDRRRRQSLLLSERNRITLLTTTPSTTTTAIQADLNMNNNDTTTSTPSWLWNMFTGWTEY